MKNKLLIATIVLTALCSHSLYAQVAPYDTENLATITNYKTDDLLVYPNPVASNAHIVLNATPVSTVFVDIVNMNGNVVRSSQYVPGTYNLDVDMSRLPAGLYSVRVHGTDIDYHNLRVIKQ